MLIGFIAALAATAAMRPNRGGVAIKKAFTAIVLIDGMRGISDDYFLEF